MKDKGKRIKSIVDSALHLILILIGLMLLAHPALAENSSSCATILVSCSIPAIPGINVPLIQEKISNIEAGTSAAEEKQNQNPAEEPKENEIKNEPPAMIQTDSDNKILLADGKNLSLAVQTLYSR